MVYIWEAIQIVVVCLQTVHTFIEYYKLIGAHFYIFFSLIHQVLLIFGSFHIPEVIDDFYHLCLVFPCFFHVLVVKLELEGL